MPCMNSNLETHRKHIKSIFEKLAAIRPIQYTAVPSFDHQNLQDDMG